ncbi:MAG: 2,3-bisphosphoglycerate-independent phosphoglycerate mutase [Gammaproteobacteria bacterium]|nr:2,3-bisphosphoglycerate-independent phosphoglycerate mutase [Gammaproteobacteria bacterium]
MTAIEGVPRRPVVLVILDGVGVNPSKRNNGVAEALTPALDDYFGRYPHTTLNASGAAVGLPDGQMGNSEVGHLTLGAGDIIRQDIVRIDAAIGSGEFFDNAALLNAVVDASRRRRPLHLLGLVSDGGVHSHIRHLLALISLCHRHRVRPLLHMITDGRDTPPRSALDYLRTVESRLHESGGAIASISGRYYAMDRDQRWERTELAWRALMLGKGQHAQCAESAIRSAYAAGDSDEFIRPILLPAFEAVADGDPLVCFNFRKDRPRQIVAALGAAAFAGFDRGDAARATVTCMMPYDRTLGFAYAFEPERPATTLGETLSAHALAQFHCAETEKYAHVTYFFNGGRTTPYDDETQRLIPSPDVATYDLKPSMSAAAVADAVIDAIGAARYAFIVVNFANGDMVGHTARRDAVIEAVETLDREVSRVLRAAESQGYSVLLTADHGNCEEMVDPFTGEPQTQHTTYPVPCLIVDDVNWQLSSSGGLANVAPTVLQLMGLQQPPAMQAGSLLLRELPGQRPVQRTTPRTLRGAA